MVTGIRPLALLVMLALTAPAHADGAMVYRDAVLFREGPEDRDYCSTDDVECEHVLTKVLSGYSYARGHVTGGVLSTRDATFERRGLSGALRVSTIEAALPGGDVALARFDGAAGDPRSLRMRATLVDAHGLFFCRDQQSGELLAPLLGMFTRDCAGDAIFAVDAGLFAMQWDIETKRLVSEWVRLGPAVELLGNGFGYDHLMRSIEIGVPFDVRGVHSGEEGASTRTTLGAGVRLSALYRTPHWEARLTARHRTTLAGRGSFEDHQLEGELLLLHNFFLSDAIAMQAGVSVRASYSEAPHESFVLWASAERAASAYAGLYLGWAHEAPGI